MKPTYYLIYFLLLISCENSASKERSGNSDGESIEAYGAGEDAGAGANTSSVGIGYNLAAPDKVYRLPESLEEISGLQYIGNGLVAAVQDEQGIVFIFDLAQGTLLREIAWGEEGDYEGLAGDEAQLWVLKSNGDVYQLRNYSGQAKPQVQKREVPLPKGCDAEGLFLLKEKGLLLIACKEGKKGIRNVWGYDLEKDVLLSQPFFKIPQQSLEGELVAGGLDRFSLGLKKMLDAKGESGILAPSAIAQHPLTHDFYILSSQSKILLVLSATGEVKGVEELKSSLFQQPESITFTPGGDMLIGNEANGAEANILMFKYDK